MSVRRIVQMSESNLEHPAGSVPTGLLDVKCQGGRQHRADAMDIDLVLQKMLDWIQETKGHEHRVFWGG